MKLRIIGIVVSGLILILVGVYLSLGIIVKAGINSVGPSILGVPVSVEKVTLSPFSGKGSIQGLVVGNPEGFSADYIFKLQNVEVELEPKSVLSDTIIIHTIRVDKPQVIYELGLRGSNVDALAKAIDGESDAKDSTKKDASEPGKKVIIDNLYITGGKVTGSVGLAGVSLPLPNIHLKDIGKDKEGTSFVDVIKRVLNEIVNVLKKVDLNKLAGKIGEVGEQVGDKVGQAADKVKGFFSK